MMAALTAKAGNSNLGGLAGDLLGIKSSGALFNAAAALVVAGKANDIKAGFALATHALDSGEAEGRLDRLIVVSNDG